MVRRLGRALIAVGLTVIGLLLIASITPQGRVAVRTALFLPQVLPALALSPQQWLAPDPVRHAVEFPLSDGRRGSADLYVPAGSGKHSAVLFFMGVVPPDRDEKRVVRLAEGLARTGMVVMIPWLDSQRLGLIAPQDVDGLVRAFQYMSALETVDAERAGMGGICTGASLAMVAAEDPRIADDVKFINSFAGYYDARDLFKAIGGRSRFYEGGVAPWKPDGLTLRLFVEHLVGSIRSETDRALLEQALSVEALDPRLSSEAIAVYKLAKGVAPDEVDSLMDQLPPNALKSLRLISPSTHIDRLKARVLIMHDRADRLVPSEESRRLADALGEGSNVYYTEFSSFQGDIQVHVDEGGGVGPFGYAREAAKLFMHMYNVLRELS